jgi:serine/threonine protein kinase
MRWLPDSVIAHLRKVADWPDLAGTKYEIIERIGQGGMACVYRARDRELERDVALKVLSGSLSDPELQSRMVEEAKIMARLEHPGIVPIHDSGILPDGRFFYAMKLIRGNRLDHDVAAMGSLPVRLRVFEQICQAVAFAHAHGVIHRDLKPQNVMVGPFGEVLVMDWGVAKLKEALQVRSPATTPRPPDRKATSVGTATDHGLVIGTPGYMAPEQTIGGPSLVDERADIYGLGGILYFLLTDQAPGPLAPRMRNASIPRPVEAICLKAMAYEPAERYPSVKDLSTDVGRFLAGLRVRAYTEGPLGLALRLAKRHRVALLLVLAYLTMRMALVFFARK